MKPMKASRTVKSSKGRSPVKKFQSRKSGPARSPQRMVPSRPSGMIGPPSGMKRPPASSRSSKPSHSRGFGSPQRMSPRKNQSSLSIDRGHGMKDRRIAENPHIMSESRNSPHMHASHYSPVPKKKARREAAYGELLPAPSPYLSHHRAGEKPRSRIDADPHRRSAPSSATGGYDHAKKFIDSSSKGRTVQSSRDGYSVPLPSGSIVREKGLMGPGVSYHHRDQFPGPKRGRDQSSSVDAYGMVDKGKGYGLTLDERFRSVSGDSARARAEQPTQYSREELENITIDIKRSMREYSPTIRRIMDPSEVKLVRRPAEGHRPLFDREEIKQASRDLREDAHFEQKMYSRGSGHYSFNYKDMENYEITRHKFDSYHGPALHTEGMYTLSEKWQRLEGKKNHEMSVTERDERSRNYPEPPQGDYDKKYGPRSLSADSDFRFGMERRPRATYEPDMRKPLPHQVDVGFKEGIFHGDGGHSVDRRGRDREPYGGSQPWYPNLTRHPSDVLVSRGREKSGDIVEHVRNPRDPWVDDRYHDRGYPKEEKLLAPSHKTGRPKYHPYADKPLDVPRDSSFHEYDGRGSPRTQRNFPGRGSSRGFRSRPVRGRLSKSGAPRGFRGRNTYGGGGPGTRGRGFLARRRVASGSYPMN